MLRLEDLTLFVRAAALGSFSETAREANIQPAQVSTAIKRLEQDLNTRLFARSTRNIRLTPEGESWLPYAQTILQTLHSGYEQLQPEGDEVSGTLQVAVPSDLGRHLLLDVFQSFRQRYPALRLKILFSDHITDVFKDPVDVAFRYGHNDDASYISLPVVAENRRVLVASPEYLARFGEPHTPDELKKHHTLTYFLHGRSFETWTLKRHQLQYQIAVKSDITSDDAEVIRRLALRGEGIAYKSWLDVCDNVKAGELQVLLKQYEGDSIPLNMICPHRQQISARVKLLHEAVKARCKDAIASLPAIEP